jgi:hypothetical protein
LRLLPNRKPSACRDFRPKLGRGADDRRLHGRIIGGRAISPPPVAPLPYRGRYDGRSRTINDGCRAPSHPPRLHHVRMLEKRPGSCHFVPLFGPPARPPGAGADRASPCRVMRSGLRCGRPGRPEARWHRCTENCHRAGGLLFTMGRGNRELAAPPSWRAAATPEGGCPAARCQTGTLPPPIVLLEPYPRKPPLRAPPRPPRRGLRVPRLARQAVAALGDRTGGVGGWTIPRPGGMRRPGNGHAAGVRRAWRGTRRVDGASTALEQARRDGFFPGLLALPAPASLDCWGHVDAGTPTPFPRP